MGMDEVVSFVAWAASIPMGAITATRRLTSSYAIARS
jgi:hypothetical protein